MILKITYEQIKLVELAEDIYGCISDEKGIGCANAGFINKGKGVLIDTMYDLKHANNLRTACGMVNDFSPKYIINTHSNGDHFWGNQIFKDVDIIGHRNMLEDAFHENPAFFQNLKTMAASSDDLILKDFANYMRLFDFSDINIVLPNITFTDKMTMELDGTRVELIYAGPAHTKSDTLVWLPKERVLFAGDIVFNNCTPICWASITKWIAALEYIVMDLKPAIIVPGHGEPCSVEKAMELQAYLIQVLVETEKCLGVGIAEPLEICKNINLGDYLEWQEPERLYINVLSILREKRGDVSSYNFIELFKNIRELKSFFE
ncbi:MAG: MBL fold metallo-hydrolase [Acidaminococcaceae bacterium]